MEGNKHAMDELLYSTDVPSSPHNNLHSNLLLLNQQAPHSPSHPLSPPSPTSRSSSDDHSAPLRATSAAASTEYTSDLASSSAAIAQAPAFLPSPLSSSSASASSPVSAASTSSSHSSPELPISLYRYQVAGHSPLLSHAGTICKPLIPQEHLFYSQLQTQLPGLVSFFPKYYGLLDISRLDDAARRELGFTESSEPLPSKLTPNHWSSSIHQKSTTSPSTQQYIVIEDLTFAYDLPCIIDLKLGKRQHGLHDAPDKVASKQKKCELTTSRSLGLRLCGMQVWRGREGRWLMKNKFDGRLLNDAAFMDVLKDFFSDGVEMRLEVMSSVLARLVVFRATLSQVREWKFFSSSLLIVYEGQREGQVESKEASSPQPPRSPSSSPDLCSSAEAAISPLLGSLSAYSPDFLSQTLTALNTRYSASSSSSLQCSLQTLQAVAQAPFRLPSSLVPSPSAVPKSSKQLFTQNPPVPSSPLLTKLYTKRRKTTHAQAKERSRERGNVDVRMIDFAHTARVEDGEAARGEEEEGLLFGFDTLIDAIAKLMDEELVKRKIQRDALGTHSMEV